jgi:hypothetical protein
VKPLRAAIAEIPFSKEILVITHGLMRRRFREQAQGDRGCEDALRAPAHIT